MRKWLTMMCVGTICGVLAELPANAQTAVNTDTATERQQPPAPIRSTTRLVQLSVVVTDKKGQPVTGLKKEDFAVFDEGTQQQLAFFTAAAPAPVEAPPKLPPFVFTNRFDLKGQDPGAVTIILFDAENTATEDQIYVRKQVMALLRTLKSQDHVALYALTSQLLILHDFTQDNSALVEAVDKFIPKEQTAFDGSMATKLALPNPSTITRWEGLETSLEAPNRQMGNTYLKVRVETTTLALKAIAIHVAAIPGRKNLLWVSGGFPIRTPLASIGRASGHELATNAPTDQPMGGCTDITNQLPCVDEETRTFDDEVKKALKELNKANVVMYPVDVQGLTTDASYSTGGAGGGLTAAGRGTSDPAQTTAPMSAEQDARDTSRLLAEQTGGVAFYGNNDIRDALKRAFDDSRYAYTIGFYPDHNSWDGKFRKIKVQAKAEGAKLRYRPGYFAGAEPANVDESKANAAMQQAALSPLDATSLGLVVSGKLSGAAAERNFEFDVSLDPKQLLLQNVDNHENGAVVLHFVQRDAKGVTIAAESKKIGFNLEEKQYEYLAREGIVLRRHLAVAPDAEEIRVLVRDTNSEALGSVTIPVATLFAAQASAIPPAKLQEPQ